MIDRWHGALSKEQIHTFADDGVLHVPAAVNADVVAEIAALADRQLAEPGQWVTDTADDPEPGRLFTSRYLWRNEPVVHRFAFQSGVSALAATCMGSSSVRLYF
ncbi:uncharacterized protein METZ01_LOCUS451545, partial [marine metagenome]